MADRYWVGGSATWDNANTAVWSDTSGGAGGAAVPTAADNAIFDANSGTVTVTLATSQVVTCLNFDCSAFTGTIAGGGNTANGLDVFGSFTLSAGMTYTTKVALRFKSTTTGNTITTAGKSMPSDGGGSFMYFLGVGGEWSLQDALTQIGSNGLVVTNGTFNSNGYNVTLGTNGFSSTGTAARTIDFGASTIDTRRWTLSGSNYSLTQAGSMTVKNTGGTLTFSGNGESYGSVTFTTAAFDITHVINGANTFANLTLTSGGAMYAIGLRLGADQIVTGTFTSAGIAPATGLWLFALVGDINSATQRTITATAYSVSGTYFVSTVIAGAGAPISGSTLGDLGNNSGITFSAPVTYYALNVTNNFWDTRRWSLTSGGSTANAVPLPQDLAVLDSSTGSGTMSGSTNNVYTGTIDSTNYTGSFSSTFRLAGSLTVGSGVASAAATFVFVGDTNTSITSNGKTITTVSASKSSGTFTVNDNLACGNFGSGSGNFTLDLNNKTVDISNGLSTGGCILDFKISSVINISGNSRTVITDGNQAEGSVTGTPTINLTYSGGTGTRTITYGAGKTPTANNIIPINVTAGTDLVVFSSNAKIGSVDFTGFSGAWTGASGTTANLYEDLSLSSTMSVATISGNRTVNFAATSGTHTIISNGTSLTVNTLTFNGVGGSWVLGDALAGPTSVTLTNGTFDADAYNVTAGAFDSSNSNVRTLDMGEGLWTLSGAGFAWNTGSATNLTLNKGTADILLSNDTSTGRTFSGGGKAYNKLTIGGATSTSTTSIAGSNSYTELASTKTVAHTISFQSNQGTLDTWSITGTSGNVVTAVSSSTGTRRTFNLTNFTRNIDYLDVKDIGVNQTGLFYVGSNSIDSGNNLNVIFTRTPNINVSNLILTLQQKINSSTNEADILYYSKAIQQLKSSNIFVVNSVNDLPSPQENLGSLYYAKFEELVYVSTNFGWNPINVVSINPLFSWGFGRGIGDGTTTNRCSQVREFCSATNWCQVNVGSCNAIAIKTSGQLWAWGKGACGVLGIGSFAYICSPVQEITGSTDWCQASTSNRSSAAVKTSGEIWTWGNNGCGQLADGTTTQSCSPVREICSATDWCQVSRGYRGHTIAIKTSGQIWVWGSNYQGSLGIGTTTQSCSPVREICSAADWCQVCAGGTHTAALKTSGELWVWGNNGSGRLGDGTTTSRCSPVREFCSATAWCQVSAGDSQTSAVKTSGELWSWGAGSYGRLGDGTTATRCSPVREICSATDWCQASAGFSSTFGIKTSGQIWGWGNNGSGRLGDGTTVNKCSPVREISSSTSWCQVSSSEHSSAIQAVSI